MSRDSRSNAAYRELSEAFRARHRKPLNAALHLVTTPLGFVAALHLAVLATPARGPGQGAPVLLLVATYALSLLRALPLPLWTVTSLALAGIAACALMVQASPWLTGLVVVVAYVGQALSHALTGEGTFQGDYDARRSWWSQLAEHTFFLLPLCIDAAVRARPLAAFFGWIVPRSGLLTARLGGAAELADLRAIGEWVEAESPALDTTTHWWRDALSPRPREAFDRLVGAWPIRRMFEERYDPDVYAVEPVPGMNEVYVASLTHAGNSDTVFYTEHVDGPFMVYPFAAVYRCIVAVNENVQIRTCFPMTPVSTTWTTGDVGGFDFNREIHRIEHVPGAVNRGLRITLKLHYCVYPKRLPWYGKLLAWLNTQYDVAARRAFLKTLRPRSLFERALSRAILACTDTYGFLVRHVGGNNIAYLLALAAAEAAFGSAVFLLGSSFIHYLLYFGAFYSRRGVAFFTFRRDAMLFKGLAALQLGWIYVRHFTFDAVSLGLIMAGIALSASAARAIGMDRTYFGSELGVCSEKRIARFPYGVVPHPMIVGNVMALAGLHAMAGFRAAAPYLALVHIGLYVLQVLQEHFDLHRAPEPAPEEEASSLPS